MSTVSIVIPTRRRFDLLDTCLESVARARRELDRRSELIVVNDGNPRSPGQLVAARDRGARVLDLPASLGFSGAVDEGIAVASGSWVLLLNDDTTVAPDAIGELLRVAESHPRVGSVCAQLRFARAPGTINSAGLVIDDLGIAADRLLGRPIGDSEAETTAVFGGSAAAALYSRRMLDEIGGFDRSFEAYLEDADVAWRARMRGWSALYAPSAVVSHHHSATARHSSDRKYYLTGRNRVRMLAKNADSGLLRRRGLSMVVYDLAYVAFVALTERTLAPLRGRFSGIRGWRSYRRAGALERSPVDLPRATGLRGALRRQRVWDRTTAALAPPAEVEESE
jgi:GT2 family glycosyltransferase